MQRQLNQYKTTLVSQYLVRLVGEIRLKVIVMNCVLLVEGAILH